MPIDEQLLPELYIDWKSRATSRIVRGEIMDAVMDGDFDVKDSDDEEIENRSPNLIQVAAEDTAESASLVPTIRIQPSDDKLKRPAKAAAKMERIAGSYWQQWDVPLKIPKTVLDMATYGFGVDIVAWDPEENTVVCERQDPRTCFVDPSFRPGDVVPRAGMFARASYLSALPDEHKAKVTAFVDMWDNQVSKQRFQAREELVVLDYYDNEEWVQVALLGTGQDPAIPVDDGSAPYYPVLLERLEHGATVCPIVISARITRGNAEFHGQFDQVVGMMKAHIQLMGITLDYADQSVYSDVWVRDLIGTMPWGGGSYISLGPQGAIGRVPPAVSSLNISQDLDSLVDGIHVGARWPSSRPGEIDQSIASAKFLETSVGMMNTAIRTYHQLLQRSLARMTAIAFMIDKVQGTEREVNGILRNQTYALAYDPADIDTGALIEVEYGLGFGSSPQQSAVLHIQYQAANMISIKTVMENIEGLQDVARELLRLDEEKFDAMALGKILKGLEEGSIPDSVLPEVAKARAEGDSLMEVFQEFVVEPQEELQQNALPTGLAGLGGMPGAPMGPPGGPPGAPGGPPGGGPAPPAPSVTGLARQGIPAGGGGNTGTLGTQVMG